MQYIVTAEEMKCYENFVLEKVGISSLLLMERAAMEMADVLMRYRKKNTRILAVAGNGKQRRGRPCCGKDSGAERCRGMLLHAGGLQEDEPGDEKAGVRSSKIRVFHSAQIAGSGI